MTKPIDPANCWNIWGQYVRAPANDLQALRAVLMSGNTYYSPREKRDVPGLTPGFAQQRAAVRLAVGVGSPISTRMSGCGKLDEHGNRHECGVTLCPRCFMLRRGRQTAENRELFAHLGNEGLAFMTVLVRVVDDLGDVDALMAKHELKIRNAITRRRPDDPRWNDVYVKGYWELEHYRDTADLGYNEARTLPALGFPAIGFGNSVWLLHCHAIVALGNISVDELRHALRSKSYGEAFQVDIQPFKTDRDVIENIKRTTRYSMKYRIEDDYKRTEPYDPEYVYDIAACNNRKWWPKEAVAALAEYLCKPRGGFQAMQFWIGPDDFTKLEVLALKPRPKAVDGITNEMKPPVIDEIMDIINDIRAKGMISGGSDAVGSVRDVGGSSGSEGSENNKISLHDTNWLKRWALDRMQAQSNLASHQGQAAKCNAHWPTRNKVGL